MRERGRGGTNLNDLRLPSVASERGRSVIALKAISRTSSFTICPIPTGRDCSLLLSSISDTIRDSVPISFGKDAICCINLVEISKNSGKWGGKARLVNNL